MREREQQAFSLRSTEFCRLDFVGPRLKVHCFDEGYTWVPKRRGFTEDQKEEFSENQRFRDRETSYPCNHALRGRDSSYLGLLFTFGLRKKGFFRFKVVWVKEKWDFRVPTIFLA